MSSTSSRQIIERHASGQLPSLEKTEPDKAVSTCLEWLARHDEQEVLAKHWQRLESYLIREHHWFQLSRRERAALPEASQLDAISNRLDKLYKLNQRLLNTLPEVKASSPHGLACKLSVALALVHPEENKEAHRLIQSVLLDVKASAPSVSE
ncbi:MAG: hypothetical protein V7675_08255 [Hyphomonas sp.]|uniref:hypothetical protein n=1 Tax=Hyphomonas sp. TaxID=87 RepID=UPI003002FE38